MAITVNEIWSDLHHDLVVDAQGSIKKVVNIDAVKTSIDNILRTAKGERVMLRDFGSDLKGMLFENMSNDLADMIADDIKKSINTWDNRVLVNSISFEMYPDRNEVKILIKFGIRGFADIFSMSSTI